MIENHQKTLGFLKNQSGDSSAIITLRILEPQCRLWKYTGTGLLLLLVTFVTLKILERLKIVKPWQGDCYHSRRSHTTTKILEPSSL